MALFSANSHGASFSPRLPVIKSRGSFGLFRALLTFNWLPRGKTPQTLVSSLQKVGLADFRVTSLSNAPEP